MPMCVAGKDIRNRESEREREREESERGSGHPAKRQKRMPDKMQICVRAVSMAAAHGSSTENSP